MINLIKENYMLIGFLSLCISAVVSIGYGVATHSEPTFDKGCWSSTGRYIPGEHKELCEGELHTPHWPSNSPVTIGNGAIADSGERSAADNVTRAVVSDINTHLGFEALSYIDDGDKADVLVLWNTPLSSMGKTAGKCRRDRITVSEVGSKTKKYGMSSIVYLGPTSSSTYDYRTLYHELGHCALALAHDDYQQSAMHHTYTSSSKVKIYRFSDDDIEAVRNYYGKD